jgi:glycine/D-amino acid oxidase-like deaminating enzyme
MRRAALAAGVRIYEGTNVVGIEDGAHPVAVTTAGRVEANTVVAALNAWTVELAAFRRLSRTMIIVSSDMVATAPAPEVLASVGWTGGEAITDSRLMVHYHRTTLDGRVAIGRGGGALVPATRVGDRFDYSPARCAEVAHGLHRFYPELARVPISHGWGGPIDRSMSGLPFFGRLPGSGNVVYGLGFTGNGVGPCVVGARILASLALREESRWSTNGLTRPPTQLFPPEPICSLGGRVVRRAVARKESIEDAGGEPGHIVRSLAGLAPAGLFKVSDAPPEA